MSAEGYLLYLDRLGPKERISTILTHSPPPADKTEAYKRATWGLDVITIEYLWEDQDMSQRDSFEFWTEYAARSESHIQGNLHAVIQLKGIHARHLLETQKVRNLLQKIKGFCTCRKEYATIQYYAETEIYLIKHLEDILLEKQQMYAYWLLKRGDCPYISWRDEKGHYLPDDLVNIICDFI